MPKEKEVKESPYSITIEADEFKELIKEKGAEKVKEDMVAMVERVISNFGYAKEEKEGK